MKTFYLKTTCISKNATNFQLHSIIIKNDKIQEVPMRLKRFLGITLALVLILSAFDQATAASMTKVVVNGKYLTFDVPPTIVQGRTLVPVRAIFEG
jgi:hypothetical protein